MRAQLLYQRTFKRFVSYFLQIPEETRSAATQRAGVRVLTRLIGWYLHSLLPV